jgi:MFS family permease
MIGVQNSRGRAQGEESMTDTFAALRVPTFRIYLAGQSVASTGTWMRSIAQDWLVLELTGSPVAVGVTMACQFLPMLLLGMYGGLIADRYPKRTLLLVTQVLNAALAAVLAVLTLTGEVRVEHVDLIALAGGLVFVVDNPARQVFVNEVVPVGYLRNAIALNAAVFQTTRLLGPAVAGVLIGTVGIGWAFAANALCYLGPTVGLLLIRPAGLVRSPALLRAPGQLRSAWHYVTARPHIGATIALVGVVGTFGLNFPVVLTAIASTTFHGGAGLYGLFNVVLAVGSVAGALAAGARSRTRLRVLVAAGAAFGLLQAVAALMPGLGSFLVVLTVMGAANLAFQAMANSSVQMWVEPAYRGRVMGLYMLAFTGGTPIGGPVIGWITGAFGARVGMAVCGVVPLLAAGAVALLVSRSRSGRTRSRVSAAGAAVAAPG